MRDRRPGRRGCRTRRRDRGLTSVLGYALGLAVATLLITGLLVGAGSYVEDRRERVVRDELAVIGQQIAANVHSADRLVQASNGTARINMTHQFPERVVGNTYRIRVETDGETSLVLTPENMDVSVEIPLDNETAVRPRNVSGGDIRVTHVSGEIVLLPGSDPGGSVPVPDTTEPSISNFDATNPGGQDVEVSFDSNERLTAIEVEIEEPGGNVVTLTTGDFTETESGGTFTYTATHAGGTDGLYEATLTLAEDGGGNDGSNGEFASVHVGTDATAPVISNFEATNPSGQDVEVTFDSNEDLSTIEVEIVEPDATTVTLTTGLFTETRTGGSYTYNVTYSGSLDGVYDASLVVAEDAAGNDGGTGQSDSVLVDSTPPSITSPTATDVTDGNGVVADGDTVEVSADVSDNIDLTPDVTANVSDFGGSSSLSLTDGNGDGTYEASFTVDESAASPDGSYDVNVTATDDQNNSASTTTGAVELDTTPPSISNFQATNPSGLDIQVSFDTSETPVDIDVPIEDSGGTTVGTLTESDFTCSGGTCSATYTAATDDTYTATLTTAADDAGNDGASGQSDTVTVSSGSPSITNPTATDLTDGNGVVTDGNTVEISADVSDPDGVSSVTADVSDFGGSSSLSLTDGNGDGTYEASFTVDESAASPDGSYDVTVTAEDTLGNTATSTTNALELDTTPPSISNFQATNPSGDTIEVSFDTSEALDTIDVSVDDSGGNTVRTLVRSDFTCSGGTCTNDSSYADDSYTVTLNTAADDAGNDGASGQSDSVVIDTTDSPPTASIDDVRDNSVCNGPGNSCNSQDLAEFEVDWSATDDNGISQVRVELVNTQGSSSTVDIANPSASGTSDSGTVTLSESGGHGDSYDIKLVVTDTDGQQTTDTVSDTADGSDP